MQEEPQDQEVHQEQGDEMVDEDQREKREMLENQ